MLLCLHIGARNALDTSQICNGVDITIMCTVQNNLIDITMHCI